MKAIVANEVKQRIGNALGNAYKHKNQKESGEFRENSVPGFVSRNAETVLGEGQSNNCVRERGLHRFSCGNYGLIMPECDSVCKK